MRTFKTACGVVLGSLLIAIIVGGCTSDQPPAGASATTQPALASSYVEQTPGAQLWSDNCARCHNLRSPETYSSTQWAVAVHHMRLRANLTGQEADKITEFLKTAN